MKPSALVLALLIASTAWAVEPAERLADPALEARARSISAVLRCLVCQNESIDESHAELARDIRGLVRRKLTDGESDAAVMQAVVDRYGTFILLRPPVRRETWLLWYGPPALLLAGAAVVAVWLRRGPSSGTATQELTETEKKQLAQLTHEDGA